MVLARVQLIFRADKPGSDDLRFDLARSSVVLPGGGRRAGGRFAGPGSPMRRRPGL